MSRAQDEQDRLARWVHEHGRSLTGFLLKMVGDRHLADDLAQEVFCRAWRARDRYTDSGQERAYLLKIAARLVHDEWRKGKGGPRLHAQPVDEYEPADEACESPVARLSRGETEQQLNDALGSLSEAQKQTLLLRFYGDLGFEEISQIMACPLSTVLSHCRRGLLALRRLLVEKL